MSWTREFLAAKHGDNLARRPSETHRAFAPSARPARAVADSPAIDSLGFIDFGARLMSLRELARTSGIGQRLLRGMVRSGQLRPIRVPGGRRLRYSPQQLVEIIKQDNEHLTMI